jgi:hypothetical protein
MHPSLELYGSREQGVSDKVLIQQLKDLEAERTVQPPQRATRAADGCKRELDSEARPEPS